MTNEPNPTRPWWRKTRWWPALAACLVLPLAYPFAAGEIMYAAGYGSISGEIARPVTLYRFWSPAGPGPAARYQAYLDERKAAGEDDRLDETIGRLEAEMAESADPATVQRLDAIIKAGRATAKAARDGPPR